MAKFIPCILLVGLCWVAGPASAENAGDNTAPPGDLVAQLRTSGAEQVVAAVHELQTQSGPQPVAAVVALLRAGPPDAVTQAALETLGALGDARAVDILGEYSSHRRAAVRVVAVQSLSTIQDSRVESLLVEALRDSNPEVRATAAQALGDGGYRNAVSVLFQAFERGVGEASAAIGKLGDADAADRFAGYLGQRDLSLLLEGLAEFLLRSDFPLLAKQRIVGQLLELAGPDVRRFLVGQIVEQPDVPANRALIQAMRDAVAQIPEQ